MASNTEVADRHIYFALDSDVLTNLAELNQIKRKFPGLERSELRTKLDPDRHYMLNKNLNFYVELLNLAKCDKIRFLITPTTYYESKQLPWVRKFMNYMCYVPKLSIANYKHQEYLVRELAKAYCADYEVETEDENGEKVKVKRKAPLSPKYNAHAGDIVPDDAYLMAEATVFNAILLTENGKHLCYRETKYTQDNIEQYMSEDISQTEEYIKNSRSYGIFEINIQKGYYQDRELPNGDIEKLVPKPYMIETIGPILKYYKSTSSFPHSNDRVFAKLSEEEFPTNPRL